MCSLDTSMKVSTLVVVSWGLHFGPPKKPAKLPGVDTSHVGRSGTLGSQPSLEKGGEPRRGCQALGVTPPKKKWDGDGESSLNYWKAECFFRFFFSGSLFCKIAFKIFKVVNLRYVHHFPIGSFSHSRLIWYVFFGKSWNISLSCFSLSPSGLILKHNLPPDFGHYLKDGPPLSIC